MSNHIVRFNLQQRIEHFVTMTTFALLCLTGLPQKFYTAGWAQVLVSIFGGVDATRWIHRITGIVLAVSTVVHFTNGILVMLSKKQYFSMVPTKKDFEDAILQLRYYLGMTQHLARGEPALARLCVRLSLGYGMPRHAGELAETLRVGLAAHTPFGRQRPVRKTEAGS